MKRWLSLNPCSFSSGYITTKTGTPNYFRTLIGYFSSMESNRPHSPSMIGSLSNEPNYGMETFGYTQFCCFPYISIHLLPAIAIHLSPAIASSQADRDARFYALLGTWIGTLGYSCFQGKYIWPVIAFCIIRFFPHIVHHIFGGAFYLLGVFPRYKVSPHTEFQEPVRMQSRGWG